MRQLLAFALLSLILSACVIGRSARPSLNESARGPSAAPVTGAPIEPAIAPADGEAMPENAKPGFTWVRGYYHWDGVHYVWQRGRWESNGATGTK